MSIKGVNVYNLGTGVGYNVLDMIHAFENVIGRPIPHKIVERRQGDVAFSYADVTKVYLELNWFTQKVFMKCVRTHGGGRLIILMDLLKNRHIRSLKPSND